MEERGLNVPSRDRRPGISKGDLLNRQLVAINVGVGELFEALRAQDVQVIHVEWRPPAMGDEELIGLLDKIL
jgi:FdrA protein